MTRINRRYQWLANAITEQTDGCIPWPFMRDRDGYGRLTYSGDGKTLKVGAHRLAFKIQNGRWPNGEARHSCDNPNCINPRHIAEGTTAQNQAEKAARGRSVRGMQQHDAKLTDEIVRQARAEYRPWKMGFHRLAKKYGVSKHAMRLAISGRTWKHVEGLAKSEKGASA